MSFCGLFGCFREKLPNTIEKDKRRILDILARGDTYVITHYQQTDPIIDLVYDTYIRHDSATLCRESLDALYIEKTQNITSILTLYYELAGKGEISVKGFAQSTIYSEPSFHLKLHTLCSLKGTRHVGSRILKSLEKYARNLSSAVNSIALNSIPNAKEFYHKQGYTNNYKKFCEYNETTGNPISGTYPLVKSLQGVKSSWCKRYTRGNNKNKNKNKKGGSKKTQKRKN